MLPIICKIGPLTIFQYSIVVSVIAAIGILIILVLSFNKNAKKEYAAVVLFWVLASVILAMIPLLTSITIYSYGLMLAIAVIICTLLLVRDAKRSKIKPEIIFDLVFWAVIGGIVGGRLFYVALNYPFFLSNPDEIVMIQKGGLAWQGALILGSFTTVLFIKRRKLFLPAVLDLVAPYLALGQSIGRAGCFLNGCCYGKEWAGGIYFPVHDAYLHPTQLYLSGGYFIIFLILKKYQGTSQIPGLVFALYLMFAASLRFVVEFFRADHATLFLGLSIFQYVCAGIFIFAVGFAYVMLGKYSKPYDL